MYHSIICDLLLLSIIIIIIIIIIITTMIMIYLQLTAYSMFYLLFII